MTQFEISIIRRAYGYAMAALRFGMYDYSEAQKTRAEWQYHWRRGHTAERRGVAARLLGQRLAYRDIAALEI